MTQILIQLVYIHGFQGNDTTFQSFPTDLQRYLSQHIPSHLKVQSTVYPTYKSVKPITFATENFLKWLSMQHAEYVVLLGHSMGGLLAADVAIDPRSPYGSRMPSILGMIAFDTPYLGMHPHVVITGIASLFSKNEKKSEEGREGDAGGRRDGIPLRTEVDWNDQTQVSFVDQDITDDGDLVSLRENNQTPRYQNRVSPPPPPPRTSSHSTSPPVHPLRSSPAPTDPFSPRSQPPSPSPSSQNYIQTRPTSLISLLSTHASPYITRAVPYLDRAFTHPSVRWAMANSDDPLGAGKSWIIEHFQFGACMFDPSGLRARYKRLVEWEGNWVNYWTRTSVQGRQRVGDAKMEEGKNEEGEEREEVNENDLALIENGIADLNVDSQHIHELGKSINDSQETDSPVFGPLTKSETKAAQKATYKADKERQKALKRLKKEQATAQKKLDASPGPPRHFAALPTGLASALGGWHNWESVEISGVEDEVAAHCGLFVPGQNLDYEGLVGRVGKKILGWSRGI